MGRDLMFPKHVLYNATTSANQIGAYATAKTQYKGNITLELALSPTGKRKGEQDVILGGMKYEMAGGVIGYGYV